MEVHAHTHTARKKWTHYFWEFVMLFLAVFCGFLAEYQLEHTIEHQREKQYMSTMLEDLKSDTALVNFTIQKWDTINKSIDSVSDAIQFPIAGSDMVKAYRHLTNALDYYSFRYNDRTISQLKNSGGFRLIRNKKVASNLILFDQFNNDAALNITQQHSFFFETAVQLRNKVFSQYIQNKIYETHKYKIPPPSDYRGIDSMIKKYKIPVAGENYAALLFEFKNALLAFRKDYTNMDWSYNTLYEKMKELIELIEEEYHLK